MDRIRCKLCGRKANALSFSWHLWRTHHLRRQSPPSGWTQENADTTLAGMTVA